MLKRALRVRNDEVCFFKSGARVWEGYYREDLGRNKKGDVMKVLKKMTPLKAIRARCLDCCCGQAYEVKRCTVQDCPLWAWRFGHTPNDVPTYEAEITEAQAEAGRRLAEKAKAVRHGT